VKEEYSVNVEISVITNVLSLGVYRMSEASWQVVRYVSLTFRDDAQAGDKD
jgi:hypothetical protein